MNSSVDVAGENDNDEDEKSQNSNTSSTILTHDEENLATTTTDNNDETDSNRGGHSTVGEGQGATSGTTGVEIDGAELKDQLEEKASAQGVPYWD